MPSVSDTLEYRNLTTGDRDAVVRLYQCAGWWEADFTSDFIEPMIVGSFATLGAFRNGELVGMGRAISDGASDGYIQDIVVDPSCRKQGVGGEIVKRLIRHLEDAGVDWIGLIGAPGTRHFYEELGFSILEEHIPMRYTPPSVS